MILRLNRRLLAMLNSLLALLNSRDYIRQKGQVDTVSIHLSKLRYPGQSLDQPLQFAKKTGDNQSEVCSMLTVGIA